MKKLFVLLFALGIVLPVAARDRNISFDQLPAAAQQFITQHFSTNSISKVRMDRERTHTEYSVVFGNGMKIEFDGDGQWKEIDAKKSAAVPMSAVPAKIREYIQAHHSGQNVREIDRDTHSYEVKLSNGTEMKFDSQFNFLKYD